MTTMTPNTRILFFCRRLLRSCLQRKVFSFKYRGGGGGRSPGCSISPSYSVRWGACGGRPPGRRGNSNTLGKKYLKYSNLWQMYFFTSCLGSRCAKIPCSGGETCWSRCCWRSEKINLYLKINILGNVYFQKKDIYPPPFRLLVVRNLERVLLEEVVVKQLLAGPPPRRVLVKAFLENKIKNKIHLLLFSDTRETTCSGTKSISLTRM